MSVLQARKEKLLRSPRQPSRPQQFQSASTRREKLRYSSSLHIPPSPDQNQAPSRSGHPHPHTSALSRYPAPCPHQQLIFRDRERGEKLTPRLRAPSW